MSSIYFTPAAISYLTQVILSGLISTYLIVVFQKRGVWNKQTRLLAGFFVSITCFVGLLLVDSITLSAPRVYAIYAENIVLGLALVFLLQFAYHFPASYPKHKIETRLALLISLVYTLAETFIALERSFKFVSSNQVNYRPSEPDYILGIILLWVPVAFMRQCIAAETRPVSWLTKFMRPQDPGARGAREFAIIYLSLFFLGSINLLRTNYWVPETFYNVTLSISILIILWLFISRYIRFIPGGASIRAKVSVITLTFLLASMGSAGWVFIPSLAQHYDPLLEEEQTLRFTPHQDGGYDVTVVNYFFDEKLGEILKATPWAPPYPHVFQFTFPYFGETYTDVFVNSWGTISLGQEFTHRDIQGCCFNVPTIFAFMTDMDTLQNGKVYGRQEDDRLVITWYRLPSVYHPDEIYTFQAVLYRDGAIDLTYVDLPEHLSFEADSQFTSNPLLRGISPGLGKPIYAGTTPNLATVSRTTPDGITQNLFRDFRIHVNEFLLPLAWLIVVTSLIILIIIPLLVQSDITRPLENLLAGVQQMDSGNLNVAVEIQYEDDIAFLTSAFNRMAATLRETITHLDQQVAERTAELRESEQNLRNQNKVLEALQHMTLNMINRHDINDILQALIISLRDFLNVTDISIDLIENGDTLVTYAATQGQPLQVGDTCRRGESGWLSWQAVDSGKITIINDYASWEKRRPLYEGYPIHAIMIIPVFMRDQIIGTINVSRNEKTKSFNATDEKAAQQLAQILALALDDAQLYNRLQAELSERIQAQDALKASEEKFYKAFHASPDAILLARLREWKLIEVNEGFSRILGYSRQDALENPAISMNMWANPADRDHFLATLHANQRIQNHQFKLLTRTGETIYGLCSGEIVQFGNEMHILFIIRDMTQRIEAENALRASEERFRQLVTSAPDAVMGVNVDGQIVFSNEEASRLLGYSQAEFLGKAIDLLVPMRLRDNHAAQRKQFMQNEHNRPMGMAELELVALHKDGHEIPVDIKLSHMQTGNNKLIITFIRDITERKNAEKKLQATNLQLLEQQRAMASFEERERLARTLHDGIGQTFGYINMQSNAAQDLVRHGDKENAQQMLSRLAEVAQEAHRDIRAYIQGLKNATPEIQQEFFSALSQYCAHLNQAYLFQVELNIPQHLPEILASAQVETHLIYIIREALSNARRHSGQKQARVSILVEADYVQATIEDKGKGLHSTYSGPERRMRGHFGLNIMRERVEEVGGSILIDTQPGAGVRVVVRLPRKLAEENLPPDRILIVDDHPLFIDGLRNMLTVRGAHIIGAAKDGIEARNLAHDLKPGMILMDINMPGMNGLEATRLIKAELPEIKIVILTTSIEEEHLFEALRAGASGYLLKGMSADVFMSSLAEISRDEAELSAEMAHKILSEFSSKETTSETPMVELTERQQEVLRLLVQGLMYKEIGEQLFLTERTVKYHMGEILARLHLKSRREAMEYAKRKGLG